MKAKIEDIYEEADRIQQEIDPAGQIRISVKARHGNPVEIGISTGSAGAQTPADAREMARKLMNAAAAVELFKYNGYTAE